MGRNRGVEGGGWWEGMGEMREKVGGKEWGNISGRNDCEGTTK